MSRLYSNRDRPFDMGVLPTESLARDASAVPLPAVQPVDAHAAGPDAILGALPEYRELCRRFLDGEPARAKAPLPDDPLALTRNLKASAYFLDATLGGACLLDAEDWLPAAPPPHTYAFVFLVEFGREPAPGEPGAGWIRGTNAARTDLRCAEVAVVLAGYLRALGYRARAHLQDDTLLDLARIAQKAGIARAPAGPESAPGTLAAPFLKRGFRIAAVSTDLALAPDLPIAPDAPLDHADEASYLGKAGTRPGWHEDEEALRPLHLGRHPMERVRRVPRPTTLVIPEEIQRVPKRADLFTRALAGDLGERARQERMRFAVKHPLALAMTPLIRGMVPMQGTREPLAPTGFGGDTSDAAANTDAVRALGYYLGADMVGVCRAEPWMWYSHDEAEGRPIDPYHPWAVVMLVDQGFETMEGASGDDWISGAQSMRAYMRGALMAGVMAAHLRRMGHSSRVHSNAHSEVLHIPATLMAGLGELSRIGEMVLNPFLGPRLKTVVFTTDLPLVADQPIDFGLQATCNMCLKCARECPCNAIPFGPKVMFNGYEIWKPDVEKCGKYRLTNARGSACGRCMKTCPYNREDLAESDRLLWLSMNVPGARKALVDHDDATGGGERNAVKRWWLDLEIVDGVAVKPSGANERDLSPGREDKLARGQKLAFFPPALQPAGGTKMDVVVPVDRAAGQAAYAAAEAPAAARRRIAKRNARRE